MSSEQVIVASYQDPADAASSVSALEAASIGSNTLSLVRNVSEGEMIGFCKSEGRIAWWGKQDALWERHPKAGFFVLPGSGPLLVTGPLVKAIMEGPGWLSTSHTGLGPLLTGFFTLGIPEGHLQEYAKLLAGGSSLVIVHGDVAEIARIHEILQKTSLLVYSPIASACRAVRQMAVQ